MKFFTIMLTILGSALMAPAVLHAQQGDQFFGSYKVSAFKSSFEQTKNTYVSGGSYDSEYITEDVAQDTVGKADNCARYRQETYSRFGNNKTTNDRVYCDLIGKVFNISSNFGPNGICNPIEMPMTGYLSIMENLKIPGCVIQDKRFRFNSSSNKYEISYSPDKYLPYNYISLEKIPMAL